MTNFNSMVSDFVNSQKTYPRGLRRQTSIIEDGSLINAMKHENNYTTTTNGATALKSTGSKIYDLFSLGGAYRARSEEDCILLFKEAYLEDREYALKCLFYLRDIEKGQGERRFFRVCLKWLASHDKEAVLRNLKSLVYDGFGRWDDLYCLVDTPCEKEMFNFMKKEVEQDIEKFKKSRR